MQYECSTFDRIGEKLKLLISASSLKWRPTAWTQLIFGEVGDHSTPPYPTPNVAANIDCEKSSISMKYALHAS